MSARQRLRRLFDELELAWPIGGLAVTAIGGLVVYAACAPFYDADDGERLRLAGELVLAGSIVAGACSLEWAHRLWRRSVARAQRDRWPTDHW